MKITTHDLSKAAGNDEEAPKIEFPCAYPIKVIGLAGAEFEAEVLEVVRRHAGTIDAADHSIKPSAKGNYASVAVTITATGEDQLQALFVDLKAIIAVKMVL